MADEELAEGALLLIGARVMEMLARETPEERLRGFLAIFFGYELAQQQRGRRLREPHDLTERLDRSTRAALEAYYGPVGVR